MNDRITVKPDDIYLEDLLEDIAKGVYKIPKFQREFVWKSSQMIELFDSILKGYPIGSLLFWKTEGYKTKNEIGPYIIEQKSNEIRYVLDGFQRISTLFGVLINPKNVDKVNSSELNNFSIFFDIKDNSFNFIRSRKNADIFSIPLYKIYDNREMFNYIRELDKEDISESDKSNYFEMVRNLHDILHKYKLPYVEIRGGDIKSAVEIFSRVNSRGTEISEDFMLSALSYNIETGFLLSDSITEFLNSLNHYNFEELKRDTVLNCISNGINGKIYFDVKIEDLVHNPNLELLVNSTYVYIVKAVEFLYKKLFIIDSRLLPYPSQLIFIVEYFKIHNNITNEQAEALKKWFWTTTYSNYFTVYSLSQQRSAFKIFCEFANGKHPDGIYRVNIDVSFATAKYPDKLNFTGVRPKALQLFYLNSVAGDEEIQDREGVKEIFISSKKDRTPANIIIRLSSEFEEDRDKKQTNNFIENSSINILEKHFITQEILDLYKQDRFDEFILEREKYLKSKERQFVADLGIKYTE
jgi:hypothetical protein